ncbi:MAG: (2Fe-2S)-binding protein [Bacteroidales bacterium]|nr:(2Fe-2S)-binding protein [Bacteroidales bacterium]
MSVIIEVNNKTYQVKRGETILNALKKHGIKIPTLCNMKNYSPTGACRMCVVEVEGKKNLVTACSFPVEEFMKIKTHSPRVIRARKVILELLLANHPDNCLYCIRNKSCELQQLAAELDIKERRFTGNKNKPRIDRSSSGIVREPAKCILCGRCVRICEEQQGVSAIDFVGRGKNVQIDTALSKSMNLSSCVECGQCILVCPTGALCEKDNIDEVFLAIHNPDKKVYVQYDPSVILAVIEAYNIKPGKDIAGKLNATLRKIGFDCIIQSSLGIDLSVLNIADELIQRKTQSGLPLILAQCPSLVTYIEQFLPEMIPYLGINKSYQQILGTLIKNYFSVKANDKEKDIFSVSIMPCISRKQEINRAELFRNGIPDIDVVLTTRELIKLIDLCGIEIQSMEDENADYPSGINSSSGMLAAVSGGITEALIRSLYFKLSNAELPEMQIESLRSNESLKKINIEINKNIYSFVAISGLKNALNYLEKVLNKEENPDFIEIMACPQGCVNGGGQPLGCSEDNIRERKKLVYKIDEKEMIKVAHKNLSAVEIYNILNSQEKEKAEVFYTTYSKKIVLT